MQKTSVFLNIKKVTNSQDDGFDGKLEMQKTNVNLLSFAPAPLAMRRTVPVVRTLTRPAE
jgi:hypothetical protein